MFDMDYLHVTDAAIKVISHWFNMRLGQNSE